MHADLQPLLADELLEDHQAKPMERLRAIRVDLTRAEGDVSLVRRISQGRLDIVGHEVGRRSADGADADDLGREGAVPTESPADASELLFDMPDILADAATGPRSVGAGRVTPVSEPGPVALSLIDALDGIASPHQLSSVGDLASGDLAGLFDRLREFEIELSAVRRRLHDRIDTIQEEIARRYRDGEASVDALLR